MAKKNSTFQTVLYVIFAIVVLARIVMLSSQGNGSTWDNSYLIWSVFLFCCIVGFLIYNAVKKKED